jgi:hypothetical protein
MTDFNPDTELERDIGYALSQSPFKVKGQRIEALRLVAAGVVHHLRRAGWLFSLRPPDELHGPTTATTTTPAARCDVDRSCDDASTIEEVASCRACPPVAGLE